MTTLFFTLAIINSFINLKLDTESEQMQAKIYPITINEYTQGSLFMNKFKTNIAKKQLNKLSIPKCKAYYDDLSNENFTTYSYSHDLDKKTLIHVIKKQSYNGDNYIIVDSRNFCKEYLVHGEPYAINDIFITFNESQTSDLNNFIKIYKINASNIQINKTLFLPKGFYQIQVRHSKDYKKILIKDSKNKYWAVNI